MTDPPFVVQNFASRVDPITLTFRTRYDDQEYKTSLPRELWVDARGEAPTLRDGIDAASRGPWAWGLHPDTLEPGQFLSRGRWVWPVDAETGDEYRRFSPLTQLLVGNRGQHLVKEPTEPDGTRRHS